MGIGWETSDLEKPREHQVFTPYVHGEVEASKPLGLSRVKQSFTPYVHGEVVEKKWWADFRLVHSLRAWRSPDSFMASRSSLPTCMEKSGLLARRFPKTFVHSLRAWRSRGRVYRCLPHKRSLPTCMEKSSWWRRRPRKDRSLPTCMEKSVLVKSAPGGTLFTSCACGGARSPLHDPGVGGLRRSLRGVRVEGPLEGDFQKSGFVEEPYLSGGS
jgi:hypothetical protein